MIKKAKLASPLIATAVSLAAPAAAFAQTNIVPSAIQPLNNISVVIRGIIQFILVAAFVLAFILLLIGGVRWITAGGDEKGVAAARNTITAALIGLVIVLLAYAIIRLVELFFNVNIITGGFNVPNINST